MALFVMDEQQELGILRVRLHREGGGSTEISKVYYLIYERPLSRDAFQREGDREPLHSITMATTAQPG